jgi:vitamin B12 transporter
MNRRLVSLSVLLLACTSNYAQEQAEAPLAKEQQLKEVVVSDSRFELKRENSGKTVIKIDSLELSRNQGRSVAEIINSKSGIELNGARSYAGAIIGGFVRGGNSRQILVIIDGIQVSDPSNVNAEYDLRLLNTSQIASIEILKGAASALYGTNAATAVINITTLKAKKEGVRLAVASTFGTNQSQLDAENKVEDFSNQATISLKNGKIEALIGFGNQFTDGLSAGIGGESDPFSRINTNAKLGIAFSEKMKLNMGFDYAKVNSSFDEFNGADANYSSASEQLRFFVSPSYSYTNGSIQLNAAINSVNREIKSSFPNTFDSQSIVADLFNKYELNDALFTIVGVNYIQQQTVFSSIEEEATSVDPYLNMVYVSDFGLNINAGARLNKHSEYGSNLVYNFNPSYRFQYRDGYFKVMGSMATSFIAPNLSQLYGPFGANTDLMPETNRTVEGGLAYHTNANFNISALYYNRKETDFIDYVITDFNTFAGQYDNIAEEFTSQGVEVELDYKPIDALSLSLNYTFTERIEEVRLRLPKHKINVLVGFDLNKNTYASLSYQYTDSRIDTDFSSFTNVALTSFNLIDLYASHQLKSNFKIFAGISNILNEEYVEVIGFSTKGRNARMGFSLNL